MKNFLIVGANFNNKGAQSMLFVTVNELKKRFKDCNIYYAAVSKYDEKKYSFLPFYYSEYSKEYALSKNFFKRITIICRSTSKDLIKFIIRKKDNLFKCLYVKKNIKKIDIILDVSGFNLGDKWDDYTQISYLRNIEIAKMNNIPIILLPQSFGPFNSYDNRKKLLKRIREDLKYPKMIFARENEGYKFLKNNFELTNLKKSCDLVLQSNKIDLSNIYTSEPVIKNPNIENNSIALVPNVQCIKHGDRDKIINIYKDIINYIISLNKKVYLIRHSYEDIEICKLIKNEFQSNNKVILMYDNFSCLEYDNIIKKFDFVICSRYHGIVHAYRNGIPCISLGWAIKYLELMKIFNQEKFVHNITSNDIDSDCIINSIKIMNKEYSNYSSEISKKIKQIQKDNCFDEVFKNNEYR